MNASRIKLIAVLSMVVDHAGLFFFPHIIALRILGRLAFPLFAWLVANGARHTHDIRMYLLRLFALALAAQVPFWYANQLIGSPAWYFNVVFTLSLGLIAIIAIQRISSRSACLMITAACALLAAGLNTDYGAAGVLSIVAFYLFSNNFRYLVTAQAAIIGIGPLLVSVLAAYKVVDLTSFYLNSPIEFIGLLSLIIIHRYNGERGWRDKYLFYAFYFLQYVAILGLRLLVR